MTTTTTRPIMTRGELAEHHVKDWGRDYSQSDDGYGDMEVNERSGFTTISAWGSDGWDLGDWPYVVISKRERDGKYELLSVCEGDHTLYRFDNEADLHAAIDYLFVWYAAGRSWMEREEPSITWDSRDALDAGSLDVPAKFRGPYSRRPR